MRRRILSIASLLSLLLCVATVVLWVRSYFVTDLFFHLTSWNNGELTFQRHIELRTGRGGIGVLSIALAKPTWQFSDERIPFHRSFPPEYPEFRFFSEEHSLWGFTWARIVLGGYGGLPDTVIRELVVPLWFVFLVLLLPAIALGRRWVKILRENQGGCPVCGYDLTANTSGICPECGSPISKTEPALSSKKS